MICRETDVDNDPYICDYIFRGEDDEPIKCFVRLLSYVEGSLLSDFSFLSSEALNDYGRFLAHFCELTR
jgi:hypothetical protein